MVENMSTSCARHCDQLRHLRRRRRAELADEFGVPLLAQVPLDPETRKGGDEGAPITVRRPDSAQARAFRELAAA